MRAHIQTMADAITGCNVFPFSWQTSEGPTLLYDLMASDIVLSLATLMVQGQPAYLTSRLRVWSWPSPDEMGERQTVFSLYFGPTEFTYWLHRAEREKLEQMRRTRENNLSCPVLGSHASSDRKGLSAIESGHRECVHQIHARLSCQPGFMGKPVWWDYHASPGTC